MQNSRGIEIALGKMIKSGGEARIHLVKGMPALVAKIYHAHQAEREAKLKAMLANPPTSPVTHTALAWPTELLYEQGELVGFLMHKIDGYDRIFYFYNPTLRKKQHPGFNRRYLHRTATNLAVAVETVHQAGHVIGDLNESNALVNDRALVTFVDTDSFQIKGSKRHIYRCTVGKAEYTPPELQGLNLSSVNQRPEHDYFGLAVLIFQLLMQGYHPFAGVLPSDLSVGRVDLYAIKEGIFPYQQHNASSDIQPPPKAPPFTHLDPGLQAFFIRCFVDGHKNPSQRPTAREWRGVLQKAEQTLVVCQRDTTHIYSSHLVICPFCPKEQIKQVALPFVSRVPIQKASRAVTQKQSSLSKRFLGKRTLSFVTALLVAAGLFFTIGVNFNEILFPGWISQNEAPSEPTLSRSTYQPVFFGTPFPGPMATIGAQNADKIEQLAYFGKGEVKDAVYSADGNLLVVASSIGVYILDAQTLEQRRFINVEASVHGVAVSPDGQMVASVSDDKMVRLWSIDGMLLKTFDGYRSYANVTFSPDGLQLASASDKNEVDLWSIDGQFMKSLSGHTDDINSIAFSPDGSFIASASSDKSVRLWDRAGKLIGVFATHTDKVTSVALSPDGQMLASASGDTVRIWSVDGRNLKTLKGHTDTVRHIAFSPDGQTLTSASNDKTIRLWNTDGTLRSTLSEHTDTVRSVAFSPDGKKFASTSNDSTMRVWETSGKLITTVADYSKSVSSIAFSPDGTLLASAEPEFVRLWSMNGTTQKQIKASKVQSMAFSPDGSLLATASDKHMTRLLSIDNRFGSLPSRVNYLSSRRSVAFSPNGKVLASIGANEDETVRLSSTDGSFVIVLSGHTSRVLSVAFSPDGQRLASSSDDQTIRLWSADGELLDTFSGHTSRISSIVFSPNGQILASASDDETVRLWSIDGKLLNALEGHTARVRRVVFSPNGQLVASASWDQTVRLWSVKDGTLLATLSGHTAHVNDIAFSPNGIRLASASWDGTVRLWGVGPVSNEN